MGNQEPYAYFYPRSPCGERRWPRRNRRKRIYNFYPRSPCGERREVNKVLIVAPKFLSTLSLRRATYIGPEMEDANGISIHALLAESDHPPAPQRRWQPYFYPRSPCGERRCKHRHHAGHSGISIHALLAESDKELKQEAGIIQQFLSTLSLRRATPPFLPQHCKVSNFYPRSPCGERQHIK